MEGYQIFSFFTHHYIDEIDIYYTLWKMFWLVWVTLLRYLTASAFLFFRRLPYIGLWINASQYRSSQPSKWLFRLFVQPVIYRSCSCLVLKKKTLISNDCVDSI